ncbi:hypothetical protein OU789_03725 [Halocynthiibacter sp. C4]|uniref:hypothetical protein n=1 Tax=Halocynthiibacter sp. C4 TaxID=2992758 RepID=UPI00237A35BA|nr:hypothetical protein [Halocynthiibacter sp. C4]MDE0589031.1 hypothetical protein [Halocynthiibacter sp. C4]
MAATACGALAACNAGTVSVGAGGSGGGVAVSGNVGSPAASVSRYVASNSMVVLGAGYGHFEVQQRAGKGGSDYWCAAGEYVIEALGQRPGTRIYLEKPFGPSNLTSAKSIGFTFAPDASFKAMADGVNSGLTMSMKTVGSNWSAEHSRSQCSNLIYNGFF